jgi:hypothetical protein
MKKVHSMRILAILALSMLAACATTSENATTAQSPLSWLGQFDGQDAHCREFARTYLNEGERAESSEKSAYSVFLSELMFVRLPEGQLPHTVTLAPEVETGRLSVTLTGDTSRHLEYEVTCQSGWFVLKKARSGQYLGDGVVEKKYDQVSYFRIGEQGELIVRVTVDAEFNSMYIFNSSVGADEWYRFRATSD